MIRIILLVFLSGISACHAIGSSVTENDSLYDNSVIRIRQIDTSFLSAYRSDPDFIYSDEFSEQPKSLLENLIRWLVKNINLSDVHYKNISKVIQILFWVIIAAILIFGFFRMKFFKVFYSSEESPKKDFFSEKQHEEAEDLEAAVNNAITNKNYRNALRYQFLSILKKLDTRNIISYSAEKTNHDYLQEVRQRYTAYADTFTTIVNAYNAIWYGNYGIDEEDYYVYSEAFKNFNSLLNEKA